MICPEVLYKVDARCFFIGDADRKMVTYGIEQGKKNLRYVPINFSNIPRVLTEHIHVNTFAVTVSPIDTWARIMTRRRLYCATATV
jgi:itaconate CoA-transferase